MCGIAGIIRFGETPIDPDVLGLLLVGNEHRGNDATGLAIVQPDGEIAIHKDDDPAWKFTNTRDYTEFITKNLKPDTWAVLLHTRAATQGNPRDNNNNHPLSAGKAAIIHNGIISNDHSLFTSLDLKRGAETDSDIIRAIVDRDGVTATAMKTLNRLSGSAAGAAVHPDYPKRLLLFRSGSPMQLASTPDFFVWASEKNTIHRAMRPWVKRFGTYFQRTKPDLDFAPMADNTVWLIDETGVAAHEEFKSLYHKYSEPFRRTYDGYEERQSRWNRSEKAKTLAVVPKTGKGGKPEMDEGYCFSCRKYWTIPKGATPANYRCNKDKGGCDRPLSAKPVIAHVN